MKQKPYILMPISRVFFQGIKGHISSGLFECYITKKFYFLGLVIFLSGCQHDHSLSRDFSYEKLDDISCVERVLESSKLIENVKRWNKNHIFLYYFEFDVVGIKNKDRLGRINIGKVWMPSIIRKKGYQMHYGDLVTKPSEVDRPRAIEAFDLLEKEISTECKTEFERWR